MNNNVPILERTLNDMNCILYTRVSSDSQIDNYSLDTQKEICEKHASRLGYTIIKTFREEGESAKTQNRPELLKLLEYCRVNKNKVNVVLIYRFDRIARSTVDHLMIKAKLGEYGVRLESATEPIDDSPTGKFLETLLASIAELDNSIRSEKTKTGMYARFKSGLSHGFPLGYMTIKENGKSIPVPDPNTFDAVKNAWSLLATGTKSLTDMVGVMNGNGIQVTYNKRKKPITKQYLSKMFKNKFYCGWLVSKAYGEEVKGLHEPMITEEMFYKVQGILSGNNRIPLWIKRNVTNTTFPLKGIVKCAKCGHRLVAGNVKGRSKKYPKYWCNYNCIHSVDSNELDKMLKAMLQNLQPNQDLVNLYTEMLKDTYNATKQKFINRREEAQRKLQEQKEMLSLLTRGNLTGKYSDEIYESEKARIEDKILTYQVMANDDLCNKYDIERTVNFIKALLFDLPKAFEESEYGQKRIFIGSIYPTGLVFDGKKLLNHEISPAFRAIKEIAEHGVLTSASERT